MCILSRVQITQIVIEYFKQNWNTSNFYDPDICKQHMTSKKLFLYAYQRLTGELFGSQLSSFRCKNIGAGAAHAWDRCIHSSVILKQITPCLVSTIYKINIQVLIAKENRKVHWCTINFSFECAAQKCSEILIYKSAYSCKTCRNQAVLLDCKNI